jgi:tripartite-type tricarboxylate transporter receptor subunit TctC
MRALCCTAAAAVLAAVLIAPMATAGAADARSRYPERPVRFVVGFSPGSATDITARMVGPRLSEMWGQPVVIENRSGAGGSIANAAVARAAPDGYTLALISASFAIGAVLHKDLPYDPIKDFVGVTQIGTSSGVLAVAASLPVKSVKDLIALAKERPGKLIYGSAGAGSGIHMTAERFKMAAGINAVHVAFKGQPEMLLEIMAGRIHYGFPGLGPSLGMIKDGRIRALAVITKNRSPLLPDLPVLAEVVPGFDRDATHGLLAPAGTPRAIRAKIAKDVATVLELPEVKQQMNAMAFEAGPTTPEEYEKQIRGMIEMFGKIAVNAGLRAP